MAVRPAVRPAVRSALRGAVRAGDGAAFNLLDPSLGTLALWLTRSDSTTLWQDTFGSVPANNGDGLKRWNDKSGNARNHLQSSVDQWPVVRSNGIQSDGVDDYMAPAATWALPTAWTLYWAGRITGTGSTQFMINADPGVGSRAFQLRDDGAGTVNFIAFNTTPAAFQANRATTWGSRRVVSACRRATEIELYVDGASGGPVATTGTPFSGTPGVWEIMARNASLAFTAGFTTDILLYEAAHTTAQRQSVEAYLGGLVY